MQNAMPPPLTLAYLLRANLLLTPWCTACTTFGAELYPEPLIARFGAKMTLDAVTALLRCQRCGARAAEVQVAVRDLRMGLRDE